MQCFRHIRFRTSKENAFYLCILCISDSLYSVLAMSTSHASCVWFKKLTRKLGESTCTQHTLLQYTFFFCIGEMCTAL